MHSAEPTRKFRLVPGIRGTLQRARYRPTANSSSRNKLCSSDDTARTFVSLSRYVSQVRIYLIRRYLFHFHGNIYTRISHRCRRKFSERLGRIDRRVINNRERFSRQIGPNSIARDESERTRGSFDFRFRTFIVRYDFARGLALIATSVAPRIPACSTDAIDLRKITLLSSDVSIVRGVRPCTLSTANAERSMIPNRTRDSIGSDAGNSAVRDAYERDLTS